MQQRAPKCKTVRGAPFVGYFLDHDNVKHSKSNYTAWMKYIYRMQNLTSESNGGTLSDECIEKNRKNPHYCFMSPHMHSFIKTPYYVFNSKYDSWQLSNELQIKIDDPSSRGAVLQFGQDFMHQFAPVLKEKQNGAMITSCICHGTLLCSQLVQFFANTPSSFIACPWSNLYLEGKRFDQHFAEWLLGVNSRHYVIDPSGPNGNETFTFSGCTKLQDKDMLQYK